MREIVCDQINAERKHICCFIHSPNISHVLSYTIVSVSFPEYHLLKAKKRKCLQTAFCLIFSTDAQSSGEEVLLSVVQPAVRAAFILPVRQSFKVK